MNIDNTLICDGFVTQADLDNPNFPKSTYGNVQVGDLKYRDMNGDGFIDDRDETFIGYSDIPENTEVVHEKAMWFEKENAKDLQKKLQMLLNDSELVKKYKTEAAPYILERYSWDIVVDQMLRVYAGDVVDYDTVLRERECGSGEKA